MRDLYQKVSCSLGDILNTEYPDFEISLPLWEISSKEEFGDFSTMVALKVASKIKEDPLEVAAKIKEKLKKKLPEIDNIGILKPGFINLFFPKEHLISSFNKLLREREEYFASKKEKNVLIEFVSANPTGPLSIAHGRQAVVGDVIANILEFSGNKVTREYYVNDEGRQIDLLVESVGERVKEIEGKNFSLPPDGYLGEYVKIIAQEVIKQKPKDLKSFVIPFILSWIDRDLRDLGVKFDTWESQKELIDNGKVEEAVDFLKKKRLTEEKEGALWFLSTRFGDDKDRVLIKKDENYTYFSSDVAYHKYKMERKFNKLINLWGPDHHGYIKRVKAAVKALGFKEEVLEIIIVQLVAIKTKQRMSRRKGTSIPLYDLVKEVGADAARFYYLMRKNSSHLEFDIDKAKEISFENPLYYVQYAHARICSVFKKAGVNNIQLTHTKFLKDEKEFLLLRKILQLSCCLDKAYNTLEPVFLIEYLKNVAACFHKFYEERRILDEEANVRLARLNLLEATRIVLACGLNILGIKPMEKM